MADKGIGQLMANHGEKVAIVLSALGLLAFAVLMITAGSTEMDPDSFASQATSAQNALVGGDPAPMPVYDFASPAAAALAPTTEYPSTTFDADRTLTPVQFDFTAPFEEQKQPPAADFRVKAGDNGRPMANHGKVTIEFKPSKNNDVSYYLLKWWKAEDAEPKDPTPGRGGDYSKTIQQSKQDEWLQDTIEGLTDNQTYKFRLKSFKRDNSPVDYTGCNGPQNEEHLLVEATPVGKERALPNPSGCKVLEATLAGVVLGWDNPMPNWADENENEEFPYVKSENVYVQFYRWSGNDKAGTIVYFTPDKDKAHPLGMKLSDFVQQFPNGWTDLNIAPEQDLHYAMRFYHTEAWPDDGRRAYTNPDLKSEIKDKSFSGERIEVEMAEIDRRGQPVLVNGEVKNWMRYRVFASKEVVFSTEGLEMDVVNLPNRAVFKCLKASMDASGQPNGPNSTARIQVTRYYELEVDGVKSWQRLTAEFAVSMSGVKKLGDVVRPDTIGNNQPFRNWARDKGYDRNATFDFSTPFELVGVYDLNYAGKEKLVYAELQDTSAKRTWPIRLFEEGSGVGQRQGNGSGLTPIRRLKAYRELQQIDKDDLDEMWDWSARWGVRFITEQQSTLNRNLQRTPHDQLKMLENEGPALEKLDAEWQAIVEKYPVGSRRSIYQYKNFINKDFDVPGERPIHGDIRAIPKLLAVIKADPTSTADEGAKEAWQEIANAFKSSSIGSRLKEIGVNVPMRLFELPADNAECAKFMADNISELAAALERHYRE